MATICIDCRYVGPRPSGIAEMVRGLVDCVPTLAPDLDFLLLAHPAAGRLSTAGNVRQIAVPQAANGPATMWWLPRVVDLSGVDLFHATFNTMPAGLRMPCVTTVHDVMRLNRPEWCETGALARARNAFFSHGIRRALKHAAAIATVSEATRDEIVALYPAAAPRIFPTISGVASDFRPRDPQVGPPPVPGMAPGKSYVLCVGQYAPYKNHDGAVRAFAQAFGDRDDIDLVFVQRRGAGVSRLLRLADGLGIGRRVHLLPTVERAELIGLYSFARALLHPSFCEGFGNPLAEAMACGCPVVTGDRSAMPEVTGGAALLADAGDPAAIAVALRRVVDDPALAATMRERGLARARDLSWRAFAAANLAVYRRVLASA